MLDCTYRVQVAAIAGLTVQLKLIPDVLDPHVHASVAQAVREAATS